MELRLSVLFFQKRRFLLARATANQLTHSVFLLNCIAELRTPKNTPAAFTGMPRMEQAEWVGEAFQRISDPPDDALALYCSTQGSITRIRSSPEVSNDRDLHAYNPHEQGLITPGTALKWAASVSCNSASRGADVQSTLKSSWMRMSRQRFDFVRSVAWLIDYDEIEGPVNLASPRPSPNAEFMRTLRKVMGR